MPHPFWLFCWLIVLVVVLSAVLHMAGVMAIKPETRGLKWSKSAEKASASVGNFGERLRVSCVA